MKFLKFKTLVVGILFSVAAFAAVEWNAQTFKNTVSLQGITTATNNIILDNQKALRFKELNSNGANYLMFQAPASLAADYTFTWPVDDGTSNQVLTTNGSGVLSWTTPGTTMPVLAVSTKTANYTLTPSDDLILCDTSSNDITLTLPTAVGNTGKVFYLKKISANFLCYADANGSQTIDGELIQTLLSLYTSLTIVSDGANWFIL